MGLTGIIIKEFKHILRDYRTLMILFLLPVLMIILFGHAMSLELQSITLAMDDRDGSSYSRELVRTFEGSGFFTLKQERNPDSLQLFQLRRADALVIIPDDYSRRLIRGETARINIDIDASNANQALIIRQYINAAILKGGGGPAPSISILPAYLYNRELSSAFFFVPALTALIIIMVAAMLTSLTITREKEQGTFDLIKLSPVHAYEIILGKVIPYLLLSLLIASLIVLAGALLFQVPIRGSIPALGFYLLLYCLTGLSFGILISTVAGSQQTAMLIALIGTLLPTLFLSGFIFQIEAMPRALRYASWIVPAKYFLVIIRGLMLKGNTQAELIFPSLMLAAFSIFFLVVAIGRFRRYLES